MAVLLFLVPPTFGFILGLAANRWSVAIAFAGLSLAVALSGWVFGWFADSDTPALGGAIVFALFLGAPFAASVCLGAALARQKASRRRQI